MTPGEAWFSETRITMTRQAEANREDGWPYPDDDSDLKEDTSGDGENWEEDVYEDYEPSPYDGTYSED